MTWDGIIERRKRGVDHDDLIITLNIVKGLVRDFEEHIKDNDKKFTTLFQAYWILTGILIAVNGLPAIASTIKIIYGGG